MNDIVRVEVEGEVDDSSTTRWGEAEGRSLTKKLVDIAITWDVVDRVECSI